MAEPNVVMLIGNTGVGKSSLGCRLLGTLPNRSPEEPFKVAMQHSAVTLKLKTVDGTWFGEGDLPLRVVDTAGLGDPAGLKRDVENMAEVGQYLNNKAVNCILFVTELNPRINVTLNRLINIVVTKVHPSDHDKLAIVINQWSLSATAKQERSGNYGGKSEKQIRDARVNMIMDAFAEYANKDNLKLTEHQLASLRNRVFFVNSHYDKALLDAQDNDKQAMDGLMDWCQGCERINRGKVEQDIAPVYPEWQAAQDQAAALKQEQEDRKQEYAQSLQDIEKRAAADRAASDEKYRLAAENAQKEQHELIQEMKAQGKESAEAMADLKKDLENRVQAMNEQHKKELHHAEQRRIADQRRAKETQASQDQVTIAQLALAEAKEKRLALQAEAEIAKAKAAEKRGICVLM